jgi:hypothetical protein
MYFSHGFSSMKNDIIPRFATTKVNLLMSFVIWIHLFQVKITKHFKITLLLLDNRNDVITFSIKYVPFILLSHFLCTRLSNIWIQHNILLSSNFFEKNTKNRIKIIELAYITLHTNSYTFSPFQSWFLMGCGVGFQWKSWVPKLVFK